MLIKICVHVHVLDLVLVHLDLCGGTAIHRANASILLTSSPLKAYDDNIPLTGAHTGI